METPSSYILWNNSPLEKNPRIEPEGIYSGPGQAVGRTYYLTLIHDFSISDFNTIFS
jgi:hypothetical protein